MTVAMTATAAATTTARTLLVVVVREVFFPQRVSSFLFVDRLGSLPECNDWRYSL